MSTELAQAHRGKLSFGLIVALVALAFAAFAVLGGRQNADASVSTPDWTVSGACIDVPNDDGPLGPGPDDCPTTGANNIVAPAAVETGTEVIYQVTFGPIGLSTDGPVVFTVDYDEVELDFVALNEDNGPTTWTCSDSAGVVSCQNDAALGFVANGSVELRFLATAAGTATAPTCTINDTGDPGQAAQPCTDAADDLLIFSFDNALQKVVSQPPPSELNAGGGTYTYTLTYTQPAGTIALDSDDTLTITDPMNGDFPDTALIAGITTGGTGTGDLTCSPSVFPSEVTAVTCTSGAALAVAAGQTVTVAITIEHIANPAIDPDGNDSGAGSPTEPGLNPGDTVGDGGEIVVDNTASSESCYAALELQIAAQVLGECYDSEDSARKIQDDADSPQLSKSAVNVTDETVTWNIQFDTTDTSNLTTSVTIEDSFDDDFFDEIISINADAPFVCTGDEGDSLDLSCTATGLGPNSFWDIDVTVALDDDVDPEGTFVQINNTATAEGEQCNAGIDLDDPVIEIDPECADFELEAFAITFLTDPVIRHLDIDAASETAAGNPDGILINEFHDNDDAVASFHGACLIEPAVVFTEEAGPVIAINSIGGLLRFISALFDEQWDIQTTFGDANVLTKSAGIELLDLDQNGLPEVYACVEWRSSRTGDQTIELEVLNIDLGDLLGILVGAFGNQVDPGNDGQPPFFLTEAQAEQVDELGDILDLATNPIDRVFYDGLLSDDASQPLIKEWNLIDETYLVRVSGIVGGGFATEPDSGAAPFHNTGELDNWTADDGSLTNCVRPAKSPGTNNNVPFSCRARANVDGTEITINGALSANGFVQALPASFLDYTLGSHDQFSGPVDGALQTYSIPATSCGSILLEDPVSGDIIVVNPGGSESVITSQLGVGFTVLPTVNGVLDCRPGEQTVVNIETDYAAQLVSNPNAVDDESITVKWFAIQGSKQPLVAWAGMRIILQKDWTAAGNFGPFFEDIDDDHRHYFCEGDVRYEIENELGAFISDPQNDDFLDGDNVIFTFMRTWPPLDFTDSDGDGLVDDDEVAPIACVSEATVELEVNGQMDVKAQVTAFEGETDVTPQQRQALGLTQLVHNFVVYYLEFEDVTTSLVPGARADHNSGGFGAASGNPWDPFGGGTAEEPGDGADVLEMTANVSADVLVRVRVRGWVKTSGLDTEGTNRPALDGKPSGRFVLPDDWRLLAGGDTAETFRPNYDIMITPGGAYSCSPLLACASSSVQGIPATSTGNAPLAGPFSLLDLGPGSGNSLALLTNILVSPNTFRETTIPDGVINLYDAPMPPALVTIMFKDEVTTGASSGFFKADKRGSLSSNKATIYSNNAYYATHIPGFLHLDPINYLWDSWGNDGLYGYWTSVLTDQLPNSFLASVFVDDDELADIQQAYDNRGKNAEIGRIVNVYSDNHGEAMVYLNGDFNLDLSVCELSPIGGGRRCDVGDEVGASTVLAVADYPDFKKRPAVASNEANVTWTWGGFKVATIQQGETDAFKYVVFHALDRDGFCSVPVEQLEALVAQVINGETVVSREPVYIRTAASQQPLVTPILLSPNPLPTAVDSSGNALVPQPPLGGTLVNSGAPYLVLSGTVLLHPVLSSVDAADTIGAHDPVENVDFTIDAGEGIIVDTSSGQDAIDNILKRSATGLETFSTFQRPDLARPFAREDVEEECQAWIKVSNSLLGILDVLVVAHDDEGDVALDAIVDFKGEFTYNLAFRWTLITWFGADNIPVGDALAGTGANEGGTPDITDVVTVVWGFDPGSQTFQGYFGSAGADVPGANDLTVLNNGEAYWIAINDPAGVTWTIKTDVD